MLVVYNSNQYYDSYHLIYAIDIASSKVLSISYCGPLMPSWLFICGSLVCGFIGTDLREEPVKELVGTDIATASLNSLTLDKSLLS